MSDEEKKRDKERSRRRGLVVALCFFCYQGEERTARVEEKCQKEVSQ